MPARFSKLRPEYLQPVHVAKENPYFEPIPQPQPVNCNLPLAAVFGDQSKIDKIEASGQIVFHCVGDTGGVNGTDVEEAVAEAMESQIPDPQNNPELGAAFFYHLGDVIYYNGQSYLYDSQFYEPYKFYPSPIVAIPGNHDGDTRTGRTDPPDYEPSLYGFFENFCTPARQKNTYRDTMTQPYVYWRLDAPFVTIIGLYGNVDGLLDGPGTIMQQQWLADQLTAADPVKALIVTVHQPPYSLDGSHGGYPTILGALDQAAKNTGVWPHAVFSGHVHDYQRFHRTVTVDGSERTIPYVVAGAGGYARTLRSLHKLQRDTDRAPVPCPIQTQAPDVWLRGYNEIDAGFMRVTVNQEQIKVEYFTVPVDVSGAGSGSVAGGNGSNAENVPPPDAPAGPFDSVTIEYRTGAVVDEMDPGTSGAAP